VAGAAWSVRTQRGLGLVLLLAAGILSLPLAAAALDGRSSENLIVPVQVLVMAVLGAIVGYLLPGIAGERASNARSVGIGALIGVGAALLGVVVFFLLISGLTGA
jgi:hypothetical protein